MTTMRIMLPALAIFSVTLAVRAQYTPGNGGTYLPPSTPVVPAPAQPAPSTYQPSTPYSWQAPAPAAPALQPASPETIRIVGNTPQYVVHADYIETPQGLVPRLNDAQIGDLTSSIALYPDPLLSEMLPAATYVQELTYIDRWMAQHPGASEESIAALPVNDSVKCMAHYPTVLAMMTSHLDWTQSLGAAFIYQGQDVMESIQRWRATAVAYGTLSSTPQMDVLQQGQTILILPPPHVNVIYVPTYDPAVVYVRPVRPIWGARNQTFVSFGVSGFSLTFVDNDVDWHHHEVHEPVHHDYDHYDVEHHDTVHRDDHVTAGAAPARGTTTVVEKKVFTHETGKSVISYPEKVITPTPNKKEVVITTIKPDPHGPGRAGETNRAPDNGRGRDNGRGPNTPF